MYDLDLSKWSSSEQFSLSNIFKKRLLLLITTICNAVYIPLTIINFTAGYYLVCTLNILYVLTLSSGTAYVYFKGRELPSAVIALILLFLIMSCTVPIYFMGITGALWVFPIVTAVSFLLPPQVSLLTNLLIVICSSMLCILVMEPFLAVRMIASLLACFLLTGIFSHRIRTMQRQLRELSNTDPMTGAYNRRLLMEMLKDCYAQYRRYKTPAVIAIFDLDYFKTINDTLGHSAGDNAIIELVRVIQVNTRAADLVFRLGGDEVLLLLRNITEDEASDVLDKICHLIYSSELIGTSTSIGATPVFLANDVEAWLKQGDDALYEAKQKGRNRVVFQRKSPNKTAKQTVN